MAKQVKTGQTKSNPPSFSPVVRLAIPNKGRIAAPVMDLVEKSGLHFPEDWGASADYENTRPACGDPLCPPGRYS